MPKRAIITGISGQDGSYLAELLLDQGYEVTGIIRRLSHPNLDRISHAGPGDIVALLRSGETWTIK